jgi:4-hydroxy-3-methylbut-2-enyl diphosphate reductase
MGMCFGVRDAIGLALETAREKPLSILGDLVHNETVLASLRERGIQIAPELAAARHPALMITAHGASDKARARAREAGFDVHEATCPLVRKAHNQLERLVADGWHPVVIGKRGHVEVRGLSEDFPGCDIVLSAGEVEQMHSCPRYGVIAQTTQPPGKVRSLVEHIRYCFPESEVYYVDTVCGPTRLRQSAAIELAQQSDVVVVIGGAESNNTRELAATCSRFCPRVHHVRAQDDLRLEWFEGARIVGVTAGTSTPDTTIDSVEQWLWSHLDGPASTPAN